MKNLLYISLIIIFASCGLQEEEESGKTVYVVCSIADQNAGKCLRYMERDIYLAFSGSDPQKNNIFQKAVVSEFLDEMACDTDLGCGYFNVSEIDPAFIEPLTSGTSSGGSFKSFIQIYPDIEFNEFADEWNFVPDQNAIVITNAANKRQFYIILRASCFSTNDFRCTRDNSVTMGSVGVKGLLGRSFASLVGAPYDCSQGNNNTMCPQFPSEEQWISGEKNKYKALFNSQLEIIRLNPNVYEEFVSETNEAP
jgi:hypothetical protein